MATQMLSDKGLSILTFAAYHQLTSGEQVAELVLRDAAGHRADPDGIREVEALGLLAVNGAKGVLSDDGKRLLASLIEQIRGVAKSVERQTAVA